MHRDHDIFAKAIREKKKVKKTGSETERRSSEGDRRSGLDRRCSTASYDGPERRCGNDRRCLLERRRSADIPTYRQFYQHVVTESIYAIERRLDGTLVGSCGPLSADDLKSPQSYKYTTELNDWLETQNDKLIML